MLQSIGKIWSDIARGWDGVGGSDGNLGAEKQIKFATRKYYSKMAYNYALLKLNHNRAALYRAVFVRGALLCRLESFYFLSSN